MDQPAHGGEPERAEPKEATDPLPQAGALPREPIADAIPTVVPYQPRSPSPEAEKAPEADKAQQRGDIAAPEQDAAEAPSQPAVAVEAASGTSADVAPDVSTEAADQLSDEAPSVSPVEPVPDARPETGARDAGAPVAETAAEPPPDAPPEANPDTSAQVVADVADIAPETAAEPDGEVAADRAAEAPPEASREIVAQPDMESIAETAAEPIAEQPLALADTVPAPPGDVSEMTPAIEMRSLPPEPGATGALDQGGAPPIEEDPAAAVSAPLDTDRPDHDDPHVRAEEIWSVADAGEKTGQSPTQGLVHSHAERAFEVDRVTASAALAQPPLLANDPPVTRPLQSAAVSTPYIPPSWPPVPLPSRPSAGDFAPYLRLALRGLAVLVMVLAAVVLLLVVAYRWIDPPASTLIVAQRLAGTAVQQRWVPLDRISPNLVQAVVLSEDGAFCRHHGVDWRALQEAIDSARDGNVRGGSTITMQVVKNLFLWSSRSYIRKAIEIPLAYLVEVFWPKRRILEIYLNIAEWGDGVFGAEAASRHHFNKRALQLTPQEAALLAVSLPNPIEREAGYAGPLTRRLAANLLVRMRAVRSATTCVGVRKFSF